MQYRKEIDGLRAVAVIPVILFHAGAGIFAGGFAGVDVFFVISGFLITSILISELEDGRFSLLRFYERRARRILPALFAVILCCLPFAWAWMLPENLEDFAASLVAVSLFFSNVLFWRESDYFAPAAEEKPLLHTWSLAVEEQYYMLVPLVLWGLWRFRRERVFWAVAAMAAASLALNLWAQRNEEISAAAVFYLTPTRAWELLAGSLCAFWNRPEFSRGSNPLSALGLALVAAALLLFDESIPFPGLYTLVPVAGTALILLFARQGTWAAWLLSRPAFVGIGLISYSAYLWHQPLFAFARIRTVGEPPALLMAVLALLSLGLAWVSWRFIEQPFRRGAASWLPRRGQVFAFSGAGMAALIALGAAGLHWQGFDSRMDEGFFERRAEIRAEEDKRLLAVRSGLCHFNRLDPSPQLQDFVRNWDCAPKDGGPAGLALYGDSHAADKAAALRLAEEKTGAGSVMQVTGAGCPLLPNAGGPGYCDRLLRFFLKQADAAGADSVVLANRFEGHELTPGYLQRIEAFWGERFDRVYLFEPMPEFHGFSNVYLQYGPQTAGAIHSGNRAGGRFEAAWAEADLQKLRRLPTRAYFCAGRSGCAPVDKTPLLVDAAHLSTEGARRFGEALQAGGLLN